jgi:hypothetical protein
MLMVPSLFQERVLSSKAGTWLVLFSASWSGESLAVEPLFGSLSKEYEGCGVHFGEVSFGEWPEIGELVKVELLLLPV